MRRRVTFSRNVTLSLSRTCVSHCKYCAFQTHQPHLHTPDEVIAQLDAAKRRNVKELLILTGDQPDHHPGVVARLRELGHEDFVAYVVWACERALERGLLPHTNLGALSRDDLLRLREVTASQGVMLESIRPDLVAHQGSPTKVPAVRLDTIRAAGELRIPFTSGLLVGIGETPRQRVEALDVLREISKEFGHLQEVIIQNFRRSQDLPRGPWAEPALEEIARTVAVARLMLGPGFNLQAPPNLNPQGLNLLLRAGVNDWGGLSPVTPDHINPQAPWPRVEELARTCEQEGFRLVERLAVYPEFLSRPGFLTPTIRRRALEMSVELEVSQ